MYYFYISLPSSFKKLHIELPKERGYCKIDLSIRKTIELIRTFLYDFTERLDLLHPQAHPCTSGPWNQIPVKLFIVQPALRAKLVRFWKYFLVHMDHVGRLAHRCLLASDSLRLMNGGVAYSYGDRPLSKLQSFIPRDARKTRDKSV